MRSSPEFLARSFRVLPRRLMAHLVWAMPILIAACGDLAGSASNRTGGVRLEIAIDEPTLWPGKTVAARALNRRADGTTESLVGVTWSSSRPDIATVSSDGLVSAVSAGSTELVARHLGQQARATLTVLPSPPLTTLEPWVASEILVPGMWTRVSVYAVGPDGQPAKPRLTFSSSRPDIAEVDSTGFIEARAPGSATIGVSAGNISADLSIEVQTARPTRIASSALTLSMAVGDTASLETVVLDQLANWLDTPITLASSDTTLLQVIGHLVVAKRPGQAWVESAAANLTRSVSVNIRAPSGSLALESNGDSVVFPGFSHRIRVITPNGTRLASGGRTWGVGNGKVLLRIMNNTVVATGLEAGDVTVHVALAGDTVRVPLRVLPAPAVVSCADVREAAVHYDGEFLGYIRSPVLERSAMNIRRAYSLLNPFGRFGRITLESMSTPFSAEDQPLPRMHTADGRWFDLAGSSSYERGDDTGISVDYLRSCVEPLASAR